jgi:hypothetical protein
MAFETIVLACPEGLNLNNKMIEFAQEGYSAERDKNTIKVSRFEKSRYGFPVGRPLEEMFTGEYISYLERQGIKVTVVES